jgi:hypothetical protein
MAFLVANITHLVRAPQVGVSARATKPLAFLARMVSAHLEMIGVGPANIGLLVITLGRNGKSLLAALLEVRAAA